MLRMYSVVPLALMVMLLCHALGSLIRPEIYGLGEYPGLRVNGGAVGAELSWQAVIRYLTFTNEIWFERVVISTGAPFWSLGFEVAYYVIFAVLFYARGALRWSLALLWLLICGPRIAAALPLWLIGVAAWRLIPRMPRLGRRLAWLALACIGACALVWRKWAGWAASPLFEWLAPGAMATSFGYYFVLGILVAAAVVVFATGLHGRSIWPPSFERVVKFCAGASFTLYIAHLPVMVLIAAIWPSSVGSNFGGLVATVGTIAAMFALAELGERRKEAYSKMFVSVCSILRSMQRKDTSASD